MTEKGFIKSEGRDGESDDINSNLVKTKKKHTLCNHKIIYSIVIIILFLFGIFALLFAGKLFDLSQFKNQDNVVHLNVGNQEFIANIVNIDNIKSGGGNTFFAKDALFVILSKNKNAPRLRLPNISVNILWLDKAFKVVSFEKKDKLNSDNVLSPPDNADFALIIKDGELYDTQIQKGAEVIIQDKMELF